MDVAFGGGFGNTGRRFPVGVQDDSHSCGIFVLNAMEHAMRGVKLFEQDNRSLVRMEYFTKLLRYLLETVSLPAPILCS